MVFIRVFSAMSAGPIFGHQSIPNNIKLFLGIIISYIISLSLYDMNIVIPTDLWGMVIYAVKEVLAGSILGFSLHFIFWAINFAGSIMGFEMGLAMAQMFDPISDTTSNVIGNFLSFIAYLLFFLINGHHYIIQSLSYSFHVLQIGDFTMTSGLSDTIIKYSASVFVLAVKISAPILISFFLVNIAEGIMARAIPQMQVFFVSQPLKLGLGFLILAAIVPIYVFIMRNLLENYENTLLSIIKSMAG